MWPFSKRPRPKTVVSSEAPAAIHELMSLLDWLRDRDERCDRVFGAGLHRYQLNPCLSEAELAQFEATHQATLPQEYRDFLKYAGNGGAGPCYGLLPLEVAIPGDLRKERQSLLSVPFPHTQDLLLCDCAPYDDEDPRWDACFEDRFIAGCLLISENGCGNYDMLVVTGPTRGAVWSDGRGSCFGLLPWGGGFFDWYRDWLEGALDVARLI